MAIIKYAWLEAATDAHKNSDGKLRVQSLRLMTRLMLAVMLKDMLCGMVRLLSEYQKVY